MLPGRSQAECFAAGFDIVDASEEYGLDVHQFASGAGTTVAVLSDLSTQIARLHTWQCHRR